MVLLLSGKMRTFAHVALENSFCIFVVKFRILFPFHDYKFEGRRLKADGRPPLAVRLDGFSHPAG